MMLILAHIGVSTKPVDTRERERREYAVLEEENCGKRSGAGRQGGMNESSDPRGLGFSGARSLYMMFSCMDRAHETLKSPFYASKPEQQSSVLSLI